MTPDAPADTPTPFRNAIGIASVIGGACSAYLLSLKMKADASPSLCNVNDVVNCDVVNSAPESMMLGVPIALLGLAYFSAMALVAWIGRTGPSLSAISASTGGIGILYSAYLGAVSARMGAVCVVCITIYACTALVGACGWVGLRRLGSSLSGGLRNFAAKNHATLWVGTLLVVGLFGHSVWSSAGPTDGGRTALSTEPPTAPDDAQALADAIAAAYAQPKGALSLRDDDPVIGNPDAPYTVLEFADFGCPHCAMASSALHELVQIAPHVQVRFRTFPLSGHCNPGLAPGDDRVDRCTAAAGARCAQDQGKFWPFAAAMFSDQRNLDADTLAGHATAVGIDLGEWQDCVADPGTMEAVKQVATTGIEAGILGTPTLFLHGAHGDQMVELCVGPEGALALVEAHRRGDALPDPSLPTCPGHP